MAQLTAYAASRGIQGKRTQHRTDDIDPQLEGILVGASREVEDELGVAAGYFNSHSATRVLDSRGGPRLWLRDGDGLGLCMTAVDDDALRLDTSGSGVYDGLQLDLADAGVVGYPDNAAVDERPYIAIDLLPIGGAPISSWPLGRRRIELTGTWGWAEVPRGIKELTIKVTRDILDAQVGGSTMTVQALETGMPIRDDTWRLFERFRVAVPSADSGDRVSTWAGARGQLAKLLGEITATVDGETYSCTTEEFPIEGLAPGQGPTFIVALPEVLDRPRRMSGYRETVYRVFVGLFVEGSSTRENAKLLDAFREAVIDKFDTSVALDGHAEYVQGPQVIPSNDEVFGAVTRPHTDFVFEIKVAQDVTVAA